MSRTATIIWHRGIGLGVYVAGAVIMYTIGLVILLLALAYTLNGKQKWVSRLYVERRRRGRSPQQRIDYALGLCDGRGSYIEKGNTL